MSKFVKANDKDLGTLKELIEDATTNNSENPKAFVPICDIVNSSAEGPKEAVKIIKKRLATKVPSVVRMTLSLLDSCVKSCGMRFHSQIFSREFLQDFLKVIKPKNNPTIEIQTTVFGLIQRWAIAFQGIQELREVCRTYEELMNRNVEFPARDPDQVSQIYILSSGNPNSFLAPMGAERRDSTRSIGLIQQDCCTVYEVEPSSATLCPTGSSRPRGKSVEPQFPHRNTLNPNGRSPSRDRSPTPGDRRRSSYAITSGNDMRVAALRKQSFVVFSDESLGGQERKTSYTGSSDGQLPVLFSGRGDRKLSYIGNAGGQMPILIHAKDRKHSYVGTAGGQLPILIHGMDRKHSYVGSSDGHMPVPVAASDNLRSELDTIKQNCEFLGEMLSSVKPGKGSASEKELMREYNLTCLEMKKRVVKLLETPEGEKLSDELLSLNDELNIVLFRYQKHSRSAALAEKDNSPATDISAPKMTRQPVMITVEDVDDDSAN